MSYLAEYKAEIYAMHSQGLTWQAMADVLSASANIHIPRTTVSAYARCHLHLKANPRYFNIKHLAYRKPWI